MSAQISSKIRSKLTYAALVRLRREMAQSGQSVGIENVLFVAKDGDDGTAVPGSLLNKYGTVQGALNAAATRPGSVIAVGPGSYVESLVVVDGTTNLAIVASAPLLTTIQSAVPGQPALSVSPTTAIGLLELKDILFVADAPAGAIAIDGTAVAAGDIFANGGLLLDGVRSISLGTSPALSLTRCDRIRLNGIDMDSNVTGPGDYTCTFRECNGDLRDCVIDRTLIRWDATQPLPVGGNRMRLYECQGNLVVTDMASVRLYGGYYEGSALTPYNALHLVATDDATYVGKVEADGTRFDWIVRLEADYNNVAPPPTADQSVFSNCTLGNDVVTLSTGGERHGPRIIASSVNGIVTANNGCDVDLRGSEFEQSNLVVNGDGAIDRTTVRLQGCTIPNVLGPVTPAPVITSLGGAPFPGYVGGRYGVLVEPHLMGAPVSWNIDPNLLTKLPDGFSGEGFINGVGPELVDCDIVLVRR